MIRPTRAIIDRDALRANVGLIRRKLSAGTGIMAVVKANCYGHDVAICVPEVLAAGADMLAVATIEEAAKLRSLGITARIVVLAPALQGQYEEFIAHDAEPFISDARTAKILAGIADAAGRRLRAHLFIDTGMRRDGVAPEQTIETLRRCAVMPGLEIIGFASHFATSEEADTSYAREQIAIFDTTLRSTLDAGFTFQNIHIANSGGIFNLPEAHYTMVRPGISLYGYHPSPELHAASGLLPVMKLRTVIANMMHVGPGLSVSYGRRYYTQKQTTLASLPLGYADGLMRRLTNTAQVLIGGRRYPVVGTICMDEVMVDLGDAPDVHVGDEVILLGSSGMEKIDAWEMAEQAGTIPYEICTNISARVPRVPNAEYEANQFGNIS